MNEIGLSSEQAEPWFNDIEDDAPFLRVRVDAEHSELWREVLTTPLRRCYITDEVIAESIAKRKVTTARIVKSKLPDPGSTMTGDFGEILVYIYGSVRCLPTVSIGPKKWRMKQSRNKPAPGTDVINFSLPEWPESSAHDCLFASEVKAKSLKGTFAPISRAIEGCELDRKSRLNDTLMWLSDRAVTEDLGQVEAAHLDRFLEPIDHPESTTIFRAVAVICESLVDEEILRDPPKISADYDVIIISVPELYKTYMSVYEAVHTAASEE